MATKSKNYKAKTAIKAVAFIVMLALIFTSAAKLVSPVIRASKSEYYHDWSKILSVASTDTQEDDEVMFWRSNLVKNQIQDDSIYLYLYGKYFYDKEAVKNGTVLKIFEEEIRNEYAKKVEDEIKSRYYNARNSARSDIYSLSWNSDSKYYNKFSSENEVPDSVVDEYLKEHPNMLPNEQGIRDEFKRSEEDTIIRMRGNFDRAYEDTVKRVSKLKSLRYVMILPDGTRVSNDSRGKNLDEKKLQIKVYNATFGVSYSNKYGKHITKYDKYEDDVTPYYDSTHNFYYGYPEILSSLQISDIVNRNLNVSDKLYGMFKNENINLYLYSDSLSEKDGYADLYAEFSGGLGNLKLGLALGVIALIILIVLLCFAGNRDENGKIIKPFIDKIPNELHLLISGGMVFGAGMLLFLSLDDIAGKMLSGGYKDFGNFYDLDIAIWLLLTAIWAVAAEWLISLARQAKAHTILRNTLIYKVGSFIRRKFKAARNKAKTVRYKLCNIRRDIWVFLVLYLLGNLAAAGLGFLGGALFGSSGVAGFLMVLFVIIYNIVVIVFLWKSIVALDKIMRAVDEAEQGNLNVQLDIASMPKWIRKFAQDVQNVQNGMRAAVDEAIKGERMKTELITNVSHDLKTPLTSIVTYVDLLKKRPIDDNEAQEYIGVLDDKSAKLKRLIEDLVEASKTTTGNVELHPVKLNLYELALQSIGENEDSLNAQGLEVRLNGQAENPPVVFADNQKTWRIIENLISNVRKYAMSGTRVYIVVEQDGGFGTFSIKNISREVLDVPVDELKARFVRGDASRTTEGSGLGLSIASSLCELQGGKLDITVDGDLFKVTVYLPLAK